ncbi:MAG: hypothetical protein MK028_01055 [Dehalococcoidia bacterium]|nr:hypothetical protein [Dehalococcoidia bacterium]MQG00270.1 hypothetical protein [SAR202 cluster bacterium]|tara:strand:+ start:23779 stop:23982 length:204 start_codon:yes stop_codon:yes gene_type:complete
MTDDRLIKCSGCSTWIVPDEGLCSECGAEVQEKDMSNKFLESSIVDFPEDTDSLDYFDKRYNSPRRR